MNTQPTLIDLFCGCGGVTQGFKNQKFRVLAAVEWDTITAVTYRKNHPEVNLYDQDIREVAPENLLQSCKIEPGELTILSVCAPCQPFSRQNRKTEEDQRTKLVLEMLRFVAVLKPRFVMMENVPGLAVGKNRPILEQLITNLKTQLGYSVLAPQEVNAVNYGVPQFRKRLIMLCSREKLALSIPEPTHASPQKALITGKLPWVTVQSAFAGLEELASGESSEFDPLHKARTHSALNLERIRCIPHNGGSRSSLPEYLQLHCHQEKDGFNDVYGRMDFSKPSNTLTTGCTNFTKGRFAHPTADRAITPREAARLQTFPDSYVFVGSYEQISTQIGNAVPVLLAEVFARYFYWLWQEAH